MSWAETLKINRNMRKPLDKLSYELFYNLAIVQNKGNGSETNDVFIVPDGKDNISQLEYANSTFKVVILPQTITNINERAFDLCLNLSTIVIPEGVQSIYDRAFHGCTSLTCVRFPSTITTISSNALDASNVAHVYVPWSEGIIANAPWGATGAVVHYNS